MYGPAVGLKSVFSFLIKSTVSCCQDATLLCDVHLCAQHVSHTLRVVKIWLNMQFLAELSFDERINFASKAHLMS